MNGNYHIAGRDAENSRESASRSEVYNEVRNNAIRLERPNLRLMQQMETEAMVLMYFRVSLPQTESEAQCLGS